MYDGFGYSDSEIALLKKHDRGEELHPYTPSDDDEGDQTCHWYTGSEGDGPECGDTSEGLMHNNTWRNVEPLVEGD